MYSTIVLQSPHEVHRVISYTIQCESSICYAKYLENGKSYHCSESLKIIYCTFYLGNSQAEVTSVNGKVVEHHGFGTYDDGPFL